jgi:hypothetical protein
VNKKYNDDLCPASINQYVLSKIYKRERGVKEKDESLREREREREMG